MARRSSSQPMAIWTNGELVGHWTPAMRRPMELRYEDSWLASRSARPLSLSLPLPLVGNEPLRGDRVEYFFDNLLPDSATIRRRLAQRYSAGSEDTFDLLSAIGRDCVGAVQLLPVDEAPTGFDRIEGEVLDDEVFWDQNIKKSDQLSGAPRMADTPSGTDRTLGTAKININAPMARSPSNASRSATNTSCRLLSCAS